MKKAKRKKTTALSEDDELVRKVDEELKQIWEQFSNKYSAHPALRQDTIYALPIRLIDAINNESQKKKRRFFSAEDEQFETELVETAGGGFFLERPFGYLSLSNAPMTDSESELDEQVRESANRLREMYAEMLRERGLSALQIETTLREDSQTDRKIMERREAFAGWLVTSAEFRQMRDAFCKQWKRRVKTLGDFPAFPQSLLGESPTVPRRQREFYTSYVQFYQTWDLERLHTWELRPNHYGCVG